MSRQKQTKLTLVLKKLRKEVKTHADACPQASLSSVRSLAVSMQTSSKTVIQALHKLVEEGILRQDAVNGRFYLSQAKPEPEPAACHNTRQAPSDEHPLIERIRHELLMRPRTKDDTIPSLTQLRKFFRCSYKAVRSALDTLEEQGFLKPEGRSFRLNRPTPASVKQSRIYIAGLPRFLYQFPYAEIFREIELVLENHGWREPGYLLRDRKTRASMPPDHHVAGFITLYHALLEKNGEAPYRLKPMIPQVIIDPTETLAEEGSGCAFFRKVRPDNAYAGRTMGIHLRAREHQRVAFITHIPQSSAWVSLRLQGLRLAFPGNHGDENAALSVFEPADRPQWRDAFYRKGRALMKASLHEFKGIADRMQLPSGDYIHSNTTRPLSSILELAELSQILRPAFDEALSDKSITAWVCVNDNAAALAHEYLRNSSLSSARKISVTGFDNLPHARMIGLTSFDFAHEAMGHAAVNAFLFPSNTRAGQALSVRGNLIVRDSSYTN